MTTEPPTNASSRNVDPGRAAPRTVIVRYKTTEAHAAANEALVRAVYGELRRRAPAGFHYATFKLADGLSFLHFAITETGEDNPLTALPQFQEFQRQLKERCQEPPVVTELTAVDGYAMPALAGGQEGPR